MAARFDIKQDTYLVNACGFFCLACLIAMPVNEQSPDSRYCQGCYQFLRAEAELLPVKHKKPGWAPLSKHRQALPAVEKPVSKIADKGVAPVGIMKQRRGRPKKEGEISRITKWRRKKELQGVLV